MLVFVVVAAVACRNETRSSASDVVKQTVDEARKKSKLNVQIRLAGSDFPTHDELALRRKLESDVEDEHIGTVLDAGSGSGYMDLTLEVDETVTTIPKMRAILNRAGLLDTQLSRSSLEEKFILRSEARKDLAAIAISVARLPDSSLRSG